MKHTIHFDNSSGVCVIQVSGTHKRPEDSHELLRIAGNFGKSQKCSRFLFDMRKATVMGDTMDAYNTAAHPEKHGFSRSYRIASVYSEITKRDQLMEDVGVNRGALKFRVFDDFEAAREWLMAEQSDHSR